jgi:hypothetical protein
MLQYALTTKTMPWAIRFWTRAIFIYFCPDRAFYTVIFHFHSSSKIFMRTATIYFEEMKLEKGIFLRGKMIPKTVLCGITI